MDVSADKYVYLKLSLVLFSDFLGFHVRVESVQPLRISCAREKKREGLLN